MATITFDVSSFREKFPEFSGSTDARLEMYFDISANYLSTSTYGYLPEAGRTHALDLMTAHLVTLATAIASGDMTGVINSSTVDKVSVTLTPPPAGSQFAHWLNMTGYGQMLLALFRTHNAGGFVVGGRPERAAFRKAYGNF